jgi:hypothetical protein
LQAVVASGWVRGAVSGIGLLNLGIAIWEIFHIKQTLTALQNQIAPPREPDAPPANTDFVRNNERRDDQPNNS